VSVWVKVSENKSGETDNLNETLNYEFLRECIQEVVLNDGKKLLEKLANDIAEKCLQHSLVFEVEVKISKPDIWRDCEPGVQIKKIKNQD
jgi:dihydroneopterin aldolase